MSVWTCLILCALVLLIFVRYGLVPAIGLAVAIIVGRKVANHIIAEGANQSRESRNNNSHTNNTTQQTGRGERE